MSLLPSCPFLFFPSPGRRCVGPVSAASKDTGKEIPGEIHKCIVTKKFQKTKTIPTRITLTEAVVFLTTLLLPPQIVLPPRACDGCLVTLVRQALQQTTTLHEPQPGLLCECVCVCAHVQAYIHAYIHTHRQIRHWTHARCVLAKTMEIRRGLKQCVIGDARRGRGRQGGYCMGERRDGLGIGEGKERVIHSFWQNPGGEYSQKKM